MTEFVERPQPWLSGSRRHIDYDALIATADNGKAVAIPCPARNRSGTGSNISAALGRRGLRVHTRYDPKQEILTVWCERRNGDQP